MSWEEMYTKTIPCLCGKGHIMQKSYGDDWNRFEDGPVIIECEDCKNKYVVEEEHHYGMMRSDGDWTIYYLTPISYPVYSGIRMRDVYPQSINIFNMTFIEYLVKSYTFEQLQEALIEIEKKGAASRLIGIARKIREDHKRRFHSVKIASIMPFVKQAITNYSKYEDNGDNRAKIMKQEQEELSAYNTEKRKHQIRIDL